MKTRTIPIILLFITLAVNDIKAQDYVDALGFRAGAAIGVTYKHFLDKKSALEGIFSTRWRGVNLTGLYELHAVAFQMPGLNWYFGGGGHVGYWSYYDGIGWLAPGKSATVIGIDGIIGMEYNIKDFPLNFSLDWKPAMNLIGYGGFWGDEVAFSIRYRFN